MCRFCLFLLSYRIGGGLHAECRGRSGIVGLVLHTECRGESRVFLFITDCRFFFFTRRVAEVTNYRIIEFSSHGVSRKVTGFITNYRIIELILSNHTENRGRSRIIELSNCFFTRRVAEGHGLSNYLHTECRRRSRIFLHTECWECGGVGDEEVWVLVFVCDS